MCVCVCVVQRETHRSPLESLPSSDAPPPPDDDAAPMAPVFGLKPGASRAKQLANHFNPSSPFPPNNHPSIHPPVAMAASRSRSSSAIPRVCTQSASTSCWFCFWFVVVCVVSYGFSVSIGCLGWLAGWESDRTPPPSDLSTTLTSLPPPPAAAAANAASRAITPDNDDDDGTPPAAPPAAAAEAKKAARGWLRASRGGASSSSWSHSWHGLVGWVGWWCR